ncbi:Zinc finger CCCH domain-containing protein 55 [Cucurbita argyrosperma subsp. argyrosperma]|nr:Zinc finger CCCH domain-containing protein 55 [Cucurbita argyrosperma subsp. argyrosperma]
MVCQCNFIRVVCLKEVIWVLSLLRNPSHWSCILILSSVSPQFKSLIELQCTWMKLDQLHQLQTINLVKPFGFPSFQNEENFGRTSVETNSSSFFPHRNFNDHSVPFTNANIMQSSGDNFPPSEFRSSFSQLHPYSRFQQPLYTSQPAHDSLFREPSQIGSMFQNYPDPLSRNHSSLLPDLGGLGITSYHNPYASTFGKPLSSSFRSNILNFGNDAPSGDIRSSTFNVSNVHVDGQGANYVGTRQTTASPNSTKPLGKVLLSTGGDQYDPLFDSIEPSLPISKKSDCGQKLEKERESYTMTSLGSSHKLLYVEENNKHTEVAAVASTTTLENDEFGETADAEAGAVEDDLDDEENLSGEIEIDQVKSSEKSKKSKGSRSLKLFRIAIADFVKEILKPSWRQGNMSKEAFKTIVKKTVDKVSGAMKSHQIPKSQAKINRYIDSSQRKLTKLVMGHRINPVNLKLATYDEKSVEAGRLAGILTTFGFSSLQGIKGWDSGITNTIYLHKLSSLKL